MLRRAIRGGGIYPVAHWIHGSEVFRTFWGFTKNHAVRRAERWGKYKEKA